MKKFLIVIAVILIIAFAGIAVFIATFDIMLYKGLIISQLERMTGNKVEMGRLSLKMQSRGALLDVEDFKIYNESEGNRTILLSLEKLEALIELAPLLARSLNVTRISVSGPEIRIIRDEEMRISIAGYGQAPGVVDSSVGVVAYESRTFNIHISSIEIRDGKVTVPQMKVPVESISLSATAESDSITVNSFFASVATGTLTGSGRCDGISGLPKTALRATFEVQGIKKFIYSILEQKQNMDGNMRLTFDGTMTGLSWPEISKTLSGGGEFYLDRGMMMNTNILSQTLGSLTLFPGLPDMVKGYVPVPIQQAFGNNDTVIEPLRQIYTVEGGYVMIPDLDFKTDTFDMRGEAKSSFTGDISGNGVIRFGQSVSGAMLQAVPEMKYITDSEGMVEFPMAFKSGDDGFKVIPDLKYVGKKVAVEKAGDMVNDFLQKVTQPPAPGPDGSIPEAPVKIPKIKDLVKNFMKEQGR
jgi:hypothetical protein